MNAEALLVLKKAGWRPGRNINLAQLRSSIDAYAGEFPLLDSTANFYKEFGELSIPFFNVKSREEDIVVIDFEKATEFLFPGDVQEEYMPRVKSQFLIPIGYWTDPSRILFIDENNKIYLGADAYLALMGNSFEEALGRIVEGDDPLLIIA